jgi:hypothetical protein
LTVAALSLPYPCAGAVAGVLSHALCGDLCPTRSGRTAQREVVEVDIASAKTRRIWSGQGQFNVVGAFPDDERLVSRFEGLTTAPDYSGRAAPRRRALRAHGELRDSAARPRRHPPHSAHPVFLPPGATRGARLPTVVYFYSGAPSSPPTRTTSAAGHRTPSRSRSSPAADTPCSSATCHSVPRTRRGSPSRR